MISPQAKALFKTVGYEPHPEQWRYHNSTARFRTAVCGRRFGKSTMAGHDMAPKMFDKGKTFWIVGPTYDLGEKEFRVVWDDLIVKMALGRDKKIRKAYNKRTGDMFIEMPWGTRLEVRSADHPDALVGEALDWVIMSEAAKHKKETFERFIRPALADRRGGADFPTTPEGFNWLYDMWNLGMNPDFPDFESWKFPSWANTAIYSGRDDPEIKLLEATTTYEWFMQEIGADFASFVGKIFPAWDETVHIMREPYVFNPAWPNFMFFDWGFTNPCAAVEVQISPNDEIFIWREHYRNYQTLDAKIAELKAREQPQGYHLDMAIGDPAEPENAIKVSEELVNCWAPKEIKSEYTWMDGIQLMNEFMMDRNTSDTIDEYGTPGPPTVGYHVAYTCTNTIKEHNNYRSNEPIKGKNVPEFGKKMDDHTLDAIRYGLIAVYKLGARPGQLADLYNSLERPEAGAAGNADLLAAAASKSSAFDFGGERDTFFDMNVSF